MSVFILFKILKIVSSAIFQALGFLCKKLVSFNLTRSQMATENFSVAAQALIFRLSDFMGLARWDVRVGYVSILWDVVGPWSSLVCEPINTLAGE